MFEKCFSKKKSSLQPPPQPQSRRALAVLPPQLRLPKNDDFGLASIRNTKIAIVQFIVVVKGNYKNLGCENIFWIISYIFFSIVGQIFYWETIFWPLDAPKYSRLF